MTPINSSQISSITPDGREPLRLSVNRGEVRSGPPAKPIRPIPQINNSEGFDQ